MPRHMIDGDAAGGDLGGTYPDPTANASGTTNFTNDVTFDQNATVDGKLNTAASTLSTAGISIPPGTGPLAPSDGDIWNLNGVLHFRGSSISGAIVDDVNVQSIGTSKTFGYISLGSVPGDHVGFYGTTPINQPNTTGTTTGYTANTSANNVFNESTFTGNVGSKAYTISDIVLALKQLGIIKQ